MRRIVCCICLLFCFALLHIADAQTRRIYIDPGHFKGNGAPGVYDKEPVAEEEITLAVALKLRYLLEEDTFTDVKWEIEMSRETEDSRIVDLEDEEGNKREVTLNDPKDRARHADQLKADLFLSIHCNANEGNGTETFWAGRLDPNPDHRGIPPSGFVSKGDGVNQKSRRFAELVQKHMEDHGDWFGRRVIEDRKYIDVDTGGPFFASKGRFPAFDGHIPILFTLRKVPGCLNEIGFLDTDSNIEKLVSPYWQWRFAEAYRDAIYEFFGLTRPTYLRIALEPGWNMLSVPGTPANTNPRSLVGKEAIATPTVRQLLPAGKGYQPVFTLRIGEGYFVSSAFPDAVIQDETMVSYFPVHTHTIHLEKGFTMIGGVSGWASFADAVRLVNKVGEAKRVNETLWTWDAGQQRFEAVHSGLMEPGVGYYVQAYEDVALKVSSVLVIAAPSQTPIETQLFANFPNPFNPETWIPFTLKEAGGVTVSIHAVSGHLVRTLDLGHLRSGFYATKETAAYWDGRNAQGDKVASGVYFYTLETDTFSYTRKMLLLK